MITQKNTIFNIVKASGNTWPIRYMYYLRNKEKKDSQKKLSKLDTVVSLRKKERNG